VSAVFKSIFLRASVTVRIMGSMFIVAKFLLVFCLNDGI